MRVGRVFTFGKAAEQRPAELRARLAWIEAAIAGHDAGVALGEAISIPPKRSARASTEPTWSAWACVSVRRRSGAPAASTAWANGAGAAGDHGVDEGDAVVLTHEAGVHEAESA